MMKVNQNSKMLRRILRKFVSGKASDAEREFLDAWERYQDQHSGSFDSIAEDERQVLQDEGWIQLQTRKDTWSPLQKPARNWFRYAAVLLVGVCLTTLGYLYYQWDAVSTIISKDTERIVDFMPGGQHAVLKLPDGREVTLSEEHEGVVFGEQIAYLDGTELADVQLGVVDQTVSLVMETPRGGNYQVTLADGTRIWLNAESRLIYPTRFDGDERIVELEGEAYFEVAKSEQPFMVKTSHQIIEVLGTEFNISAYSEASRTTTTLVNGSVNLRSRESAHAWILKPGEQATVQSGGQVGVRKVDVAEYIAWKDGLFLFNDTPLADILGQLKRWYDFKLENEDVPDLHFNGGIRRDVPLSQVLDMLESTTNEIHFEVENNGLVLRTGRRTMASN